MKIKRKRLNQIIFVVLGLFFCTFIILGITITTSNVIGANITNTTVVTRVNVTNTEPNLYEVSVIPSTINLNPGGVFNVICNASVYEANGWTDIRNVSATLYHTDYGDGITSDNNFRYINNSCLNSSNEVYCESKDGSANNASCYCVFPIWYYAYNGSWQCNMTVSDSFGLNSTNWSSIATVNTVLGIDTPTEIDFGNLSVTERSSYIRGNITNWGNVPINITVRGFGGSEETPSTRNLSMVCPTTGSLNISNTYERYSLTNTTAFENMFNISNTSRMLNLTIPFRENDITYGNSTNATFWRLEVPVGVTGACNGTIIFGAVDAS
jgi:hypothetical protein